MRWITTFTLVGLGTALAAALSLDSTAAPRLLDETRATYLEDELTGRQLASLHLRLEATGAATRLAIEISAKGAEVDPVPGFRGVHGANHITARELTELYLRGQLRMVTMPRGGSGKRVGSVRGGDRGRIPERHLRPDGTLQLDGASLDTYLVSVRAISPALDPGEHEVYLEAKGIPRLRADVHIGADATGTILGVHSLAGHNLEVQR